MLVEASAPTRIDLAGGTLDIYPLYLFMDWGITVNAAIDLLAWTKVEEREDSRVHILSQDMGLEAWAADVASLALGGELDLVARLVKFYAPRRGVNLTTHIQAPKGSGLGASSSLLIAITGALDRLNSTGMTREQMIDYGANIEAQSIRIPTGKQDYYAAIYGGVNAIWFQVKGNRVEPLVLEEEVLSALEDRIVLSFTGISHFSATSNWNMLKAYIDELGTTVHNLNSIRETARAMREALLEADMERFAALVGEEWENRKSLAEGVTNPRIDTIIQRAREAGALSSKLCGAGGGGCMITVVAPGRRQEVVRALEEAGARHLPFRIARRGLEVRVVG